MQKQHFLVALTVSSALVGVSPALAQAQPTADAASLQAQVNALQKQLDALKKQMAASTPSWKGAPQFEDKGNGWSFKPRGRLQYDIGWVGRPDGVADRGLGFSNELRRGRIGVEGEMPGGFGYKFEVDFADAEIDIADALLSYDLSDNAGLVIGHHNNFQSLEELTSSRFLSFMERAAFTDAFNFERRVGVSANFSSGDLVANVGAFSDNIGDLAEFGDDNNSYSVDGRVVYAPKRGATQLHLGGSAHYRDNNDVSDLTRTRYRQRPFIHTSDVRFLATPSRVVGTETNYGLEAAMINGPFHAAAEANWLTPNVVAADNPTFFGGYIEAGFFLTGETRGYRNGVFDRTKVLRPVNKGGSGAFQINLRYDHLDLNDANIRGGKQQGYEASLIWIPQDHVRFLLNYGHLVYEGAAIPAAGGDRDYSVDVVGARAQIDF